ncbi:MAG TPA: GGDEF domain-containing protein [Rubrivivax sp.]|nr:GGDEF domain-containing protein [Rubrivivax sp.]HRZ62321.1 GGDEF domain-containing protein [Rubrivivax sp.]
MADVDPNPAPIAVLTAGAVPAGLAATGWGPLAVQACRSLDEAAAALAGRRVDALLLAPAPPEAAALEHWPAWPQAVLDAAVVVVLPGAELAVDPAADPPVDPAVDPAADPAAEPAAEPATASTSAPALARRLVERGAQDVLPASAADADSLARALHLAVQRRRLARAALQAQAIDLATGLPNAAQLREYMVHLLALREREPAPMAVLVLRIEGLATTEAALGPEAANVLRRKAAVRLRAGLRASDVVAALGPDSFGVLLAYLDAPADAARVADKLVQSLRQPLRVAGHDQALAVSVGVAAYPQQGRDAGQLLHVALAAAAALPAAGRSGFANRVERGAADAANDA